MCSNARLKKTEMIEVYKELDFWVLICYTDKKEELKKIESKI
jgi:hypothetical protein